jgi:hypothetical protein
MLRIRLREHHQLDVSGIALQFAEGSHQVGDLIVGQRQSPIAIGLAQSAMTVIAQADDPQRPGCRAVKQPLRIGGLYPHRLRHPIVQVGRQLLQLRVF